MKKSFLNSSSPLITEMVQVPTAERAEFCIRRAIKNGADAVGFQMQALEKKYRTREALSSIFAAAGDKPVYLTNYRGRFNQGMDDDELCRGLLFGLECGATLIDVMGDTFDPSPEELTASEAAIAKQMKLIDTIHSRGGEVLISSHIKEFRSAERVLEIAFEHERRGADISKIVTGASTVEEGIKNLDICRILKEELKIPFLFLSSGEHSTLHRTVGTALGVNMWLCFSEYDETTYKGPPLISDVIRIKKALKL